MPATGANICDRHFCHVSTESASSRLCWCHRKLFLVAVFVIFFLQLRQVFLRFLFRLKTHFRTLGAEFYHITVGFLFEHGGIPFFWVDEVIVA